MTSDLGAKVLTLWGHAVRWFTRELVDAKSDDLLRKFLHSFFPEFDQDQRGTGPTESPTLVLQSLLKTWVKWFADPNEALAFMGKDTERLVRCYKDLCHMLNPVAPLPFEAPNVEDRDLWPFPTLQEYMLTENRPPQGDQRSTTEASNPKRLATRTGDRVRGGR